MAEQITNYKCPACSGPMQFDPKSGMMKCDYCDSTFTVEDIEARYAEKDAAAAAAKKEADNKPANEDEWAVTEESWNGEGMKSYTCPSCGATLVCEDTMAASSCPYCGNPTVVPGQFTGMLKPDYVIPFKLGKDEALETLKKHYGKRYLLPKEFKINSHLEEVKGVYVPFWLYDGKSSGDCTYECEIVEKKRQGDEEIITTKYYSAERKGSLEFKKIPADASTKMDDSIMDSIEPYDYSGLKEFNKAYLTGYLADKYDVSAEEDAKRAVARAKESTRQALKDDLDKKYTSITEKRSNINVEQGKAHYAMMPVWMLQTNWNGKNYTFAMNGQTGRMVGDLPVNMLKLWITIIAVCLAVFGIGAGVAGWSVQAALIVGVVVAAITGLVLKSGMKSVHKAHSADDYIVDNSLKITHRKDTFIRENVERKKVQTNN